jgi:endonuclease/exonuclease/phosphatase family metal-dependent hydrolase
MTRAGAIGLVGLALAAGCASPVRMAVAPGPYASCRAIAPASRDVRVAWIGPRDERERRALDARCAQVGLPILPVPSVDPPVARRVLVATWNMHDGRGDVLSLVGALRRGSDAVPAPDAVVVLLQEVVRSLPASGAGAAIDSSPAGVKDIPSVLRRLGWHLAYLPGKRNRLRPDGAAGADRGVAILSSLPLTNLEAIELPLERQRRVALSAIVVGRGEDGRPWQLRVVSVHLENRAGARRVWMRAGASRTRQTEALLEALALSPAGAHGAALATNVGGDFNVWLGPREHALTLLRERLGAFPDEDTRPTMDNGWRLDYLFPHLLPSLPATHRRLNSTFGSDHFPVVAALDLGTR